MVGTGERCLPGDADSCGDGGKAIDARLSYPKGLAIGPEGRVYIADGNNIRMVDERGLMSTLAGHQHHRASWQPLPCLGSLPLQEVQLNWPTDLAISPLDGTLHVVDDSMVLQVTADGRVRAVAGRPLHCHPSQYPPASPQAAALTEPQSIGFSPTGELYIAESDSQRINRVRRISHNRQVETIAGKNSNCNCLESGCKCYDPDTHLAAATRFSAISAVAVSPDGRLYVADQGNYRVRAVASRMPTTEEDAVFEVPDPDTAELYSFNRFGQHVQTKDIMTGAVQYSMEYHQSTSTGRLVSITDSSGRKLSVLRDYSGGVTGIQTSNGLKNAVGINRMGDMASWTRPDGFTAELQYEGSTGLLVSRLDTGNLARRYSYDQYGRLESTVAPTGLLTPLHFNLTGRGAEITAGGRVWSLGPGRVREAGPGAGAATQVTLTADRTLEILQGERRLSLVSSRHPTISHGNPVLGDSYPLAGQLRVERGQNLVSKLEWEYSLQTSGHDSSQLLGISKKLRVNGENLLVVTWDSLQRRELLYLADKTELLETKYDEQLRPVAWASPHWAPASQQYDRFGHLVGWAWGERRERYSYDKEGRLVEVATGNSSSLVYSYSEREPGPARVSLGTGASWDLEYGAGGGVEGVLEPGGGRHGWQVQPGVGRLTWSYTPPWPAPHPFSCAVTAQGDLLEVRLPGGQDRVTYTYTAAGRLHSVLAGQTEVELAWDQQAGTVESVFVSQGSWEMRERRKYHSGMLKEQKIRIAGMPGFDNANIKYQLDGTGRPARVNAFFGRKESLVTSWKYNQNTGSLAGVGNLKIRKVGFNKTEVQDLNGNFLKAVELDKYGSLKSIIYTIKRRQMLGVEVRYDSEGRVGGVAVGGPGEAETEEVSYSYTTAGWLAAERTSSGRHTTYQHDQAGNLVGWSEPGRQPTAATFGPGGRVQESAGRKVMYDSNGFVAAIDNQKFLHNGLGQLVEHVTNKGVKVNYYYDQLNRLVAWTDSTSLITQYFYTNPIKPNQVSYVHNPRNDMTQKLTYDANDHLVMIETPDEVLYVASDHQGSPLLIVKQNGNVVKRIRYTTFGEISDDSQPGLHIPIGFCGGLASQHGGFLHLAGAAGEAGRVYHPGIKQWLGPAWQSLQQSLTSPAQLYIYRYRDNSPVGGGVARYMTRLADWAGLHGFQLDRLFHASLGEAAPAPLPHHTAVLAPAPALTSELDTLARAALSALHDIRFIRPAPGVVERRRESLLTRFATSPHDLGAGFLLATLEDNKAVAYPVEVQNSVVQKIFESVLNNSIYLDVSYSEPGKSVYYFVKPGMSQFALDSDTVRRLAGEFTVSPKDVDTGKELSIVNSGLEVRVLYGAAPAAVRAGLLRRAGQAAVSEAWAREQELVRRGLGGAGDWSPGQVAELLAGAGQGRVRGYEAVELQPADRFPQLARDPTNFEFVRSGARNRKNRHGGRRKHGD